MGEGKSEGGPGVDRGGGRGCQPGPGLSSGSLFLPRVSLGAAGDNVALSGVAGGGGTRRTERYPPAPLPRGPGGLGAAGRASGERFPQGRGGGFLLSPSSSPPSPPFVTRRCPEGRAVPSFVAVPMPAVGRGQGRWPVPITRAFGVPAGLAHLGESIPLPAHPPTLPVAAGGTPVALPPPPLPHRQPRPSRRDLLSPAGPCCRSSPGGRGTPPAPRSALDAAGRGGYGGGYIPLSPPHFRLSSIGNRNIPPFPAFPQLFPLFPAPR